MRSDYREQQRRYFGTADVEHFRWQTSAPYIARTEAELLEDLVLADGERLLEIGCGEGGNLYHLAARFPRAILFGTDFSPAKAAFARRATSAHVLCADATALPFAEGSFERVLIRDLLHHVADRATVLAEACRVLRLGGRLMVIEPNGRSPLVLAQAAAVPAERGVLRSTDERLRRELAAAGLIGVSIARRQPLPVSRLVLHPRLGLPALGRLEPATRTLARLEEALAWLPRALWTYLVCQGTKPHV